MNLYKSLLFLHGHLVRPDDVADDGAAGKATADEASAAAPTPGAESERAPAHPFSGATP